MKSPEIVRLDQAVHARTPSLSRSFAEKLVKQGKVKVGNMVVIQTSFKVKPGSKITVDYQKEEVPKINLPIMYEDDDCVVIDKPAGILAHSKGGFNPEATVATWLQPQAGGFDLSSDRNGIVHRLDRATSGLMICAKNPRAQVWLQKQFSSRKTLKTYFALIEGEIEPEQALIDMPIERDAKNPRKFNVSHNGKSAQTSYKTNKRFTSGDNRFSLLELTPRTGRTHQLRVHLKHLKKPILGDNFYDGQPADRLYLHAAKLEITLPNKQRQIFESKLPTSFLKPKLND